MEEPRLERSGAFVSNNLMALCCLEIEVKMLIPNRWFYIVLMNTVWIAFPLWGLRKAYLNICGGTGDANKGPVSE